MRLGKNIWKAPLLFYGKQINIRKTHGKKEECKGESGGAEDRQHLI